jgi:SAM-dependent methyltransferase
MVARQSIGAPAGTATMNAWLQANLVCPRHKTELTAASDRLTCAGGCSFSVIDGMPMMLLDDPTPTLDVAPSSLRQRSEKKNPDGGLYVETLGLSTEEKRGVLELARARTSTIDPVVSFLVAATNGVAYRNLVGRLHEYPIPELRMPPGDERILLDVGCSWGRWSIAAARAGYRVVGIDPSLGAVMAARRVARELDIDAAFIVGDARFLPFAERSVDCAFSYSVLQHFSEYDVALVAAELGRVVKQDGACVVQMPTKFGLRCAYQQVRRRFRAPRGFEVRYWTLPALERMFSDRLGPTTFAVDCFFGIGLQFSDIRLMSLPVRAVVAASEILRRLSRIVTPLVWIADSVYVSCVNQRAAS